MREVNVKQVVVVGGGISGLATAHRLVELSRGRKSAPAQVTLLEAKNRLGGVIQTELRDGFLMEAGPDAFISEKPWALELIEELGVADQLILTRREFQRSFIVQRGKLVPVPQGFYLLAPTRLSGLLRMPFLSPQGKIRMALEPFIPARANGEDESVGHFIRRRFGQETLDRMGQPMIAGIYSADPNRLSLQATFPKFHEMERRYGSILKALQASSGAMGGGSRAGEVVSDRASKALQDASGPRYSLFMTLRGGMQKLVERLIEKMPEVTFRTGAGVRRLEPGRGWKLTLEDGETMEADAVCIALPAPKASVLVSSFAPDLSQQLEGIPYESVATVNMAYHRGDVPHPLDGFGFVVPSIEKRALMGCTFSSVKFPGRAAEDTILLRAFVGGAFGSQTYALGDDELTLKVRQEFRELLGIQAAPILSRIARYPETMPQYHVGHLDRVALIERQVSRYPGLYLTGNAYRGGGIPDCIQQARVWAERISKELTDGTSR